MIFSIFKKHLQIKMFSEIHKKKALAILEVHIPPISYITSKFFDTVHIYCSILKWFLEFAQSCVLDTYTDFPYSFLPFL